MIAQIEFMSYIVKESNKNNIVKKNPNIKSILDKLFTEINILNKKRKEGVNFKEKVTKDIEEIEVKLNAIVTSL